MRYLVALIFFIPAFYAEAYVPVRVEQATPHDIIQVDPQPLSAYYGLLDDSPHTFEIRKKQPFQLSVEVRLPKSEGEEDLSLILVQETGAGERVREVTRLLGADTEWEQMYDQWTGEQYRKGKSVSQELDAGVYRLEVSTPDNRSPYILLIGTDDSWGNVGYFEMVGRIADMKSFLGKHPLAAVQSPLLYIPLGTVLLGIFVYVLYKNRRKPVL